MSDRIKTFETELTTISDGKIKKFVEELLDKCDDYFFTTAASTTGKYHPQYALGNGGLVRHTKAAVGMLNHFLYCECFPFTSKEQDLMRAALIVHDIKKLGNNKNAKYTVKDHPALAAQYVRETNENSENKLDDADIAFMCDAIEHHMGQWGQTNFKEDASISAKLVHMADCMASRKNIDFIFDAAVTPTVITEKKEKQLTVTDPAEYELDFGKHKDKKLKDIPESYLEWVKENISREPTSTMVKEFFRRKQKKE